MSETYDGQGLAELAAENKRLKGLMGGPETWALEADVLERQQRQWAEREARRRLDAEDWKPPVTAPLAAELELPRQVHRYRIDGLAGHDHNVLVAGPRKVGKSQLMINLAAALSQSTWGRELDGQKLWGTGTFLGPYNQCRMGGNVAYVNAEMDADDWRDEFRRLPPGICFPARIRPLHCRGIPLPVITSPAARAWFVTWLRENQTEVLIIDTWGAFAAKNGVRNLNDDAEARRITDGLDAIKAEAGVRSLFVLIHMPHQTGEKHAERFKGAGAVGDWADSLWSYVKDEDGIRYLSAEGRARIDWRETALAFSTDTGQLWWGMTGSRAQTSAGRQRDRMLKALADAGSAGLLTGELMEAAGGHTDTARKAAREMAQSGELETRAKANAVRYFLPGLAPVQGAGQS